MNVVMEMVFSLLKRSWGLAILVCGFTILSVTHYLRLMSGQLLFKDGFGKK